MPSICFITTRQSLAAFDVFIGIAPIARLVVIIATIFIAECIIRLVTTNRIDLATFVVFDIVGDEVVERKPIVRSDEIDRVIGRSILREYCQSTNPDSNRAE